MSTDPTPFDRYAARTVRLLEVWAPGEWKIKLYGIAYRVPAPAEELVRAAKAVAASRLPEPAVHAGRYGVGFMGVHQGKGANLVFLDWWADENELRHHVFTSTPRAPEALRDMTGTGLLGCVWDISLIAFERQAWIATTLARSGTPDLKAYLAFHLEGAL